MSEMIERAAQAIYESRNGRGTKPWAQREWAHKQPYLEDARVAIKALRKLPENIVIAVGPSWGSGIRDDWESVIDEALK